MTALSFGLLPFTQHIAVLIALMSLLSAGALPIVEAITLASLAGQSGRYGPIRLWGSIGFIAVVLAGGVWLDFQPVSTVPAMLVVFVLLTLAAALALPRGQAAGGFPRGGFSSEHRSAARLFAAGFCNAVAHGALYAFFSLHLEALRLQRHHHRHAVDARRGWRRSWCSSTCRSFSGGLRFRRFCWQPGAAACCVSSPSAGRRRALDSPAGAVAARRHFRLVPRRGVAAVHRVFPEQRKPAARRCFPASPTAPARPPACCSPAGRGRRPARR